MDETFTIPERDALSAALEKINSKPYVRDTLYPLLLAYAGKTLSLEEAIEATLQALSTFEISVKPLITTEDRTTYRAIVCVFVDSEENGNLLYESLEKALAGTLFN